MLTPVRRPIQQFEYIVETNRVNGDNIARAVSYFERQGIPAERIPHKTTLRLFRPANMTFPTFARIVRGVIQRRIGSLLMFSTSTGNAFLCSNRGNRPGRFVRINGN